VDGAAATATMHAMSNVAAAARRDFDRPFANPTSARFQRMKLKVQADHKASHPLSQRSPKWENPSHSVKNCRAQYAPSARPAPLNIRDMCVNAPPSLSSFGAVSPEPPAQADG